MITKIDSFILSWFQKISDWSHMRYDKDNFDIARHMTPLLFLSGYLIVFHIISNPEVDTKVVSYVLGVMMAIGVTFRSLLMVKIKNMNKWSCDNGNMNMGVKNGWPMRMGCLFFLPCVSLWGITIEMTPLVISNAFDVGVLTIFANFISCTPKPPSKIKEMQEAKDTVHLTPVIDRI